MFAGYFESCEARTKTNTLGEIYPAGIGQQKEAGVKTGCLDRRITPTISCYRLTLTNNILQGHRSDRRTLSVVESSYPPGGVQTQHEALRRYQRKGGHLAPERPTGGVRIARR